MKERPILFNGEMVRAILGGRKTQTRRVIKNPADLIADYDPRDKSYGPFTEDEYGDTIETASLCPFGVPGDRLWVREAFHSDVTRSEYEDVYGGRGIFYRATEIHPEIYRWKPSIQMPRWASRITLEITGVRVERLQDISEEDAIAEGVYRNRPGIGLRVNYSFKDWEEIYFPGHGMARCAFAELWESINGSGSWAANPWVWVVEFKKEETKCPE